MTRKLTKTIRFSTRVQIARRVVIPKDLAEHSNLKHKQYVKVTIEW